MLRYATLRYTRLRRRYIATRLLSTLSSLLLVKDKKPTSTTREREGEGKVNETSTFPKSIYVIGGKVSIYICGASSMRSTYLPSNPLLLKLRSLSPYSEIIVLYTS